MNKRFVSAVGPFVQLALASMALGACSMALGACVGVGAQEEESPSTTSDDALGSSVVALDGYASVTLRTDATGMPHVRAPNELSGYAGLCFATARDRFAQMDLLRLTGEGKLSSILGQDTLFQDLIMRGQNVAGLARQQYLGESARAKALLTACAAGVNTYLRRAKQTGTLPLEYAAIGSEPAPWKPEDSVIVAATMAASLDIPTWLTKLQFGQIATLASPEIAAALLPFPDEGPSMFDSSGALNPPSTFLAAPRGSSTKTARVARFPFLGVPVLWRARQGQLGLRFGNRASNNFAIDGALTTTGKPFVGDDPHLGLTVPSYGYLTHLEVDGSANTPGFDIAGWTIPGFPLFLSGQNKKLSWGITLGMIDSTDLYLETTRGTGANEQVLYKGRWVPVGHRVETIEIAGGAPLVLDFKTTPHGSAINPIFEGIDDVGLVTLKTSLIDPAWTVEGFTKLPHADTWNELRAAVADVSVGLNWVGADTTGPRGHVAHQLGGLAPQRNPENGVAPVPGGDGAHEWTGFATLNQLPHVYDPPSHFVTTANNRLVPSDYAPGGKPIYISNFYDEPWRAQRLHTMILDERGRFTPRDAASLQLDTKSVVALELKATYLAALARVGLPAGDPHAARARLELSQWNGDVAANSLGAAIYEVLTGILIRDAVVPVLGADGFNAYASSAFYSQQILALQGLLEEPRAPFFGATGPANAAAARDKAVKQALATTDALLAAELGNNPSRWSWGGIHTITYNHPLASADPRFAIGTFASGGDVGTVNVGGWFGATTLLALPPADFAAEGGAKAAFAQDALAVVRLLWNTGDRDDSLGVLSVGQSGDPRSRHYKDQASLWRAGAYNRLSLR